MMGGLFRGRLYRNLPISVQENLISIRSRGRSILRENSIFLDVISKKLSLSEGLSDDELKIFQLDKLKKIVKFSQHNIAYYRDLFKRIGFDYRDLVTLSVIEELPCLTKEIIRENPTQFSPGYPWRWFCIPGHTSGTTGSPLAVYHDLRSHMYERAFQRRLAGWAKYRPGMKKIWLRGDLIVPVAQSQPPYWRENRAENQLMMSSYHISEETLPEYIRAIKNFSPQLIDAFPSAIYSIAKYMKDNSYVPLKVGAIITSSETLFPEARQTIEEMFSCRVFDWYGSYERVAAIFSCEYGHYHIVEDYGYTELVPLADGYREVVSTGFYNHGMPLIRYRTGDLIEPLEEDGNLCPCGRSFRQIEYVLGRTNDYVILPNGRKFQGLGFLLKNDSIMEGQIYQNRDFSIEIRVVPKSGFDLADKQAIENSAYDRFGSGVKLKVVCVTALPRSRTGKLKSIISEISDQ